MCISPGSTTESLDEVYINFEIGVEGESWITTLPNVNKSISTHRFGRLKTWHLQVIKPDKDGDHLVSTAIILGKTDIAMMLIDLIPDYKWLSRQNNMFQTALHIATLTNNLHVVRRLIVAGINISKQDWGGNTALHIACQKGLKAIAAAILTPVKYTETKLNSYEIPYQAIPQNLEIRNADGLTCLLIAVTNKDRDIIDLLIDREADINAFDLKSGKTCLHILTEYCDCALIKFMLSKSRINVNAKTYSGYTALQLAISRGYDQIVYLLRCAGADEIISDEEISSDSSD
ncbi:NF-kappa-B inhibitor cactus-like [Ruditapes philippinarum]|uniref:NF-kappa-B inhibitor cactus-like n=1 Tax=Ruditapes philippinarum TaxID=129788 RepID=UPI00295C387F|nr:NF-kappa-B inhibitor cactus-like [Ruditapes philippinarum]